MTLSEYTHIIQQIVFNVGKSDNHHLILMKLKSYYMEDIDSERRSEQIKTVGQFLKVLEIRDVLSEDKVEPLKEIARKLKNDELISRISEYETNHVPRDYVNSYGLDSNQTPIKEVKNKYTSNQPCGTLSSAKSQRINDTIVQEIGKYWRDLARNLKIQECKIDDIDTKHQTLPEKATELLNFYYENKADPQRWFHVLCKALEKSRRKDLSKSIQEIMVMNL